MVGERRGCGRRKSHSWIHPRGEGCEITIVKVGRGVIEGKCRDGVATWSMRCAGREVQGL